MREQTEAAEREGRKSSEEKITRFSLGLGHGGDGGYWLSVTFMFLTWMPAWTVLRWAERWAEAREP